MNNYSLSPQQSHVGSVPRTAPVMIADAHPTPESTDSAPGAQFMAQAPHSMQASRSMILAFFSTISKTACGQTSMHFPHPVHFEASSSSVTTFSR
jgi:hypothetical protein